MPEGCMLSPLKRAWVVRGLAHPQLKLGSNRMPVRPAEYERADPARARGQRCPQTRDEEWDHHVSCR